MLPVVVCQRSSSGKKGRKLSIDSDGTIDIFLPFENQEENSPPQIENSRDASHVASMYASLKTRKTVELKKKRGTRKGKEKGKRSSISSEGTIVEDLVLSGGQSLSENMQETEDFSEKNEYSRAIFPDNTESQYKANQSNIFADTDKTEEFEKNGGVETWRQDGKEGLLSCGSNGGRQDERNLLITFLQDEITSLQHR